MATTYEQVTYNSPDGAVIGKSSTEKIAFYGGTPAVQRAEAAMGTLTLTTATSGGFGFVTATAFDAFTAQLEELRATLVALGLHKGSA